MSKDISEVVFEQTSLAEIATKIDEAHDRCQTGIRTGLEQAAEAGWLLSQAKALVPHGEWLDWLAENCPRISVRTAQTYQQVARSKQELTDKARGRHRP